MNVLVFFILIAFLVAIVAGVAFFIALKQGQFDDLEGAAYRILYDDDLPESHRVRDKSARSGHDAPPDKS